MQNDVQEAGGKIAAKRGLIFRDLKTAVPANYVCRAPKSENIAYYQISTAICPEFESGTLNHRSVGHWFTLHA